jgi:arylsulfatase A-like enzyme
MAGNHGLMSKCILYEQSVRVPLIVRPPGGSAPLVVDDLVEHIDVPATIRAIADAPAVAASDGRPLLAHCTGHPHESRRVAISENWGFASFETDRYRLIVDEDRRTACQLFDLELDPVEDDNLVGMAAQRDVLDLLMREVALPFLATPAQRPHPSPFA